MSKLQFFSLVTFPIEIVGPNDQVCGKATGFFHSKDEESLYLVTNWHVVTGKRDSNNPSNSETGIIPQKIVCLFHENVSEKYIQLSRVVRYEITINDEDGNAPIWLEHPEHRHKIDVIVIKITGNDKKELEGTCKFSLLMEYPEFDQRYKREPMDTVFVIGYPWGLSSGNLVLPLYKRGSVASEPIVISGGLPKFLIDCRTSEGMSGAPVIVAHTGYWAPDGDKSQAIIGTVTNFVGVYSGRLWPSELEKLNVKKGDVSEIGIVWKQGVIGEIIKGGVGALPLSELIK